MVRHHYGHWLPKLMNVNAVTIGNNIYYKQNVIPEWLVRHELKHVEQYRERGTIGFLLVYGYEYLIGRLEGKSHYESYRNISFEREAREAEDEVEIPSMP
jgi:hypothetical protein